MFPTDETIVTIDGQLAGELRTAKILVYKSHINSLFDLINSKESLARVGPVIANRITELEGILLE